MTPDERLARRLFLDECWRPVKEWHPSEDDKARAQVRNESLAASRGEPELPFRGAA